MSLTYFYLARLAPSSPSTKVQPTVPMGALRVGLVMVGPGDQVVTDASRPKLGSIASQLWCFAGNRAESSAIVHPKVRHEERTPD